MCWRGDRCSVVVTIDEGNFPCTTTGFAEGPSSRALCRGSQLGCAAIAWTGSNSNLFNGCPTIEHRFDASESGAEPVGLASRRPQGSLPPRRGEGTWPNVDFSSSLYRLARSVNDVEALSSGNPERVARRAKNKLIGRLLGRTLFRWLWR